MFINLPAEPMPHENKFSGQAYAKKKICPDKIWQLPLLQNQMVVP